MATHIYKEKVSQQPNQTVHRYEEKVVDDGNNVVYTYRNPAASVIYFLLDVLEVILAVRLVLRLLAANPGTPFVNFMYAITNPFVAPFRAIFSSNLGTGGVIDWATVAAMIVYALVAYLIIQLINMVSRPTTQ